MRLHRVGRLSDIPEGTRQVVEIEGEQVLLINDNGRIYAVSNICTHEYAELENGLLVDDTLTCPVHLSRFRLEDGRVLNPPATKNLKTYPVSVKAGEIFVEL
jgi:3-phenylpropionate/trans-cinnamate dioxygenase ferredoxin subunit